MGARAPLLVMDGVSKHYEKSDSAPAASVLHDIDLTVHAGEWLAIVGPSGSGKSTLMHLLGCLDRPTSGRYAIDARLAARPTVGRRACPTAVDGMLVDVGAMTSAQMARLRRDAFGFIFQRYHLLDYLDAADNVALPAQYRGALRTVRRRRAMHLLAGLGLARKGTHLPAALSGGQQQRVSLARALMNDADVILADEPTGALDSASGERVLALLRTLHAAGRTVIVVTHAQEVAAAAQRIVTMRDGRIVSDVSNPLFDAKAERDDSAPAEVPIDRADALSGTAPEATAADDAGMRARQACSRAAERLIDAWRVLMRHRLRSLLMVASIMMGIAAVVLMLAVGAGARNKLLEEMRSYGADATYIQPGSGPSDRRAGKIETLTLADAQALRLVPDVLSVSAVSMATGEVIRGTIKAIARVSGVETDYFQTSTRRIVAGQMFGPGAVAQRSPVAVIDTEGYKTLFPNGGSAIGQRILVGRVPVMIVGIIEMEDNGLPNTDVEIHMPVTAVQSRLSGRPFIDYIRLGMRPGAAVDVVEAAMTETLLARHRRKDFYMTSFTKYIEIQKRTARTMSIVMLISAAIALSIGGIGVMNMMLVAVRERVAEIGIRIAIGARHGDIARQFLLEALVICLLGGVAGVALSLAVASVMPWAAPTLPLQPTPMSLMGACLGSILIGLTFGLLPARQAARMDPIKALTDG